MITVTVLINGFLIMLIPELTVLRTWKTIAAIAQIRQMVLSSTRNAIKTMPKIIALPAATALSMFFLLPK